MADPGEGSLGSIFRRGGSKKELFDGEPLPDKQELNQQLQQLAVAWAIPKAKKGLAAAVWRPLVGAFEVIEQGRQHFNGQGFMHKKKLYLNVEEAVFMMDQAELLLLIDKENGQQQLLSMQEAIHLMASLGISHDRLQVLAHLSRLGYHVRRHPSCWYAPADQPAAATWQVNPAWRHTDGLLPSQQSTQAAAATAADNHAGTAAASDMQHTQEQQQQARKKQKMEEAPAGAAAAEVAEQQELVGVACKSWWDRLPYWLQGLPGTTAAAAHQSSSAAKAGAISAAAAVAGAGADGVQAVKNDGNEEYQLLGVQLQQRFPELQPLPTYTGLHEPKQQQQQQLKQVQQTQQDKPLQQQQQQQPQQGQQQDQCSNSRCGTVAELVYDAVPCASHFSYKCPPAPLMSFAMVKDGCHCLPSLSELLQLCAAAADGTAGLRNGQGAPVAGARPELMVSAAAGVAKSSSVMVATPDGSDVNYYELRPISLMNLLTNQA